MSITDELLEWARNRVAEFSIGGVCDNDLNTIADRIESEYAAYRAAADTKLKEYVKLPVDADGVPIHVGDMVGWDGDEEFEVKGFGGSRAERLFYLNESGRFCWGIAENCHHVQPDSWERIMDDAEKLARGDNAAVMELVERCRRLAGEGA